VCVASDVAKSRTVERQLSRDTRKRFGSSTLPSERTQSQNIL
jgi:hypothetical protein